MDEYIDTTLQELQHAMPKQHFKGPSKAVQPQYRATIQYIEDDTSPAVCPVQIKYIQKFIGKFLFMTRALDNNLLHGLNKLARKAATATEDTLVTTKYLHNYIATNRRPRTQFRANDMIFYIAF